MTSTALTHSVILLALCCSAVSGQQRIVSSVLLEEVTAVTRATGHLARRLGELASNENEDKGARQAALVRLGELQSRSSIRPLVRNLAVEGVWSTETGPLAEFPAALGLLQFGSSSYQELLGELWGRR